MINPLLHIVCENERPHYCGIIVLFACHRYTTGVEYWW